MSRFKVSSVLMSILALAFGLRFLGVGWGMPYAFHADEDNYLPGAITMLFKGDLNPHYFRNPPLLTYTVLLELLAYLQVGKIFGFLNSPQDIGMQMLQAPTPLYVLARMNGVVTGTATVLVTYLAARRLFGTRTGLLAALLLSVAFLHVRDSHYVVNDVPATFLLMVSFYFATRVYRPGRPRDYLLSGLFLGLATATKYNVGMAAVAIVAAHLLGTAGAARLRTLGTHLPLVAAGATSLAGFLLANPFSILDSATFLTQFRGQYGWTADPFNTSDSSTAMVILRSLSVGTSPLMLAASLLGLGLLARPKPREALLLACFPVAYLAFFLWGSSLFYARFAIPVIPFVAILAGYAASRVMEIPGAAIWRTALSVLVVAALAIPPALVGLRHDQLLRTEDTRQQLGRWIEANVPPGSKIAVEGYSFVDFWGRRVGPKKLEYQVEITSNLQAHTIEYYRNEGFDYLVASSFVYARYLLDPGAHAAAIEGYSRMDRELPLAAALHPTEEGRELPFLMDDEITPIWTVMERDRPGPTIKIYRVGEAPQLRVRWVAAEIPAELAAGQKVTAPVTVSNAGNRPWPNDGYSPVRLGYRWLDANGREVSGPDVHSSLPGAVAPGEAATLQAQLATPTSPGVYTLQMDMVQENFAWFSAKGAETRDFKVTVK